MPNLMDYLPAIFGILDTEPEISPTFLDLNFQEGDDLGSFKYVQTQNHIVLKCQCGRQTQPYLIKKTLFDRVYPTQGKFACAICLLEQRSAKTIKDHLKLVLAQNKDKIEKNAHLVLDFPSDKIYDPVKQQMVRIKRLVYELYYNVELDKNQKVLVTCGNKNCVSPEHLLVAASPATKVTPEMRNDIKTWASNKMSNTTIQNLVSQKYQRSISLRTIINVKKSFTVCANLAI